MKLPPGLRDIERMLGAVSPAGAGSSGGGSGGLDRDEVMFQAGRAAGKSEAGPVRLWQGLCGALVAACVGLALVPRGTGNDDVRKKDAAVTAIAHAEAVRPVDAVVNVPLFRMPSNDARTAMVYWRLRDRLLLQGMSALPASDMRAFGPSAPALRPGDGLDAIPRWQRQAELGAGDQS